MSGTRKLETSSMTHLGELAQQAIALTSFALLPELLWSVQLRA
jgi:hypothetical protein